MRLSESVLPRPKIFKTIFKKLLLQYYHTALVMNYNVDDPYILEDNLS